MSSGPWFGAWWDVRGHDDAWAEGVKTEDARKIARVAYDAALYAVRKYERERAAEILDRAAAEIRRGNQK